MAKPKDRWQPENPALNNNPFAALSGLKSTTTPDQAPAAAPDKPSTVKLPKVKSTRLERAQRGGKTVTVVAFHGQPSADALNLWLKSMKKDLGVGGAVENDAVILQGDQRERIQKV